MKQRALKQAAVLDCLCAALGRQMDSLFLDAGASGQVPLHQRPQGALLASLLEPGDIVITARLSRLSRSLVDLLDLESWFQKRGIGVVTASGTWIREDKGFVAGPASGTPPQGQPNLRASPSSQNKRRRAKEDSSTNR